MEVTQMTEPAYTFAFTTAAFLLVGCSDMQQVGSHRYRVPAENLVSKSSYPFFLPPSSDDGFIFILNPGALLTEQHSVLVQERSTICSKAKGREVHVNSTVCAAHKVEWRRRRWLRNGDETFWTYSPETPSRSPAPFVSCHKMEITGHTGLCSATVGADDLVLTIGLNADDLPALDDIYEQSVSALRAWKG